MVATQVDLSPLLDILMSLLSNKLTTNESVQNAVFTSSLFLLHTAGERAPWAKNQALELRR